MRRLAVSIVTVLVALGLLAPWGLYELGLSNIEGRPDAPPGQPISSEDDTLLRRALRAQHGISVVPLSPGGYFVSLFMANSKGSAEDSGADAAWLVARNYNASHLKNSQSLWWHLSGAALTIWVTRNWTPNQVLSRGAEIVRQHSRATSRDVVSTTAFGLRGVPLYLSEARCQELALGPARGGETLIQGCERKLERLRDRHIPGVVAGHSMT
jgi:hypothetical protein